MARIRSIKPEYWSDRKLAQKASRDARLLYISLWNMADEHGRLNGDSRWIKGHCLPYDDDISLAAVDRLVEELVTCGRVQRYEADGDPYLFLVKLADHQRLEPEKSASRLPAPPDPSAAQIFSDESAPDSDESETIVVQQVAGCRLQVAGSREHVAPKNGAAEISDRPRDLLWEALTAACGVDTASMTKSERGKCNAAVKAIRDAGAVADDVPTRAENYRRHFTAALTPAGLAANWGQCANGPQPRAAPPRLNAADQRAADSLAIVATFHAHDLNDQRKEIT